ncbi:RNA ligase family protein [Pseudolysinimonas sp.]|uniref:RNA ligase family protein n=1 Tax=Pseudolysinimonas sp. TaxID=2680009 RepID=UPI003F7FE9CC
MTTPINEPGTPQFEPWPKIARLNRDIVVTEKIDGTNAAVLIVPAVEVRDAVAVATAEPGTLIIHDLERAKKDSALIALIEGHAVFAQSRTRFITATKQGDNMGFAGWVERNAGALVRILGAGRHFGEWWGSNIQRSYGRTGGEKTFSLFNTTRWSESDIDMMAAAEGLEGQLDLVPELYSGPFDEGAIQDAIAGLRRHGSVAAPGFERPEGVVIYHVAARTSFKVTLEGDEEPKRQSRDDHGNATGVAA